ncbi:undecaprenyldiphospho-muramoylpentapeptide beta-N-acetylglucosaminyltransferase [bacterium]|nr:undecaprenyldiphospho-muramoylpentapeptide beta-N-acetylglucosaminyltransferase [bacterium]MBU1882641.1 undecaprenyldiphospho-muramoylpentapeptide beta-N-acetylglucosaminyltransferase [bacterium]
MRFCITGGGTGGHLSIADALCNAAVARGHEVIFIGSTSGQDKMWFEQRSSFSHTYFLQTSGVVNKSGPAKIKALYKIFAALLESRKILKKHKVQAVISVGGFSAAPASFASFTLGLPLFIHEQNAVVGKLNSILRPHARSFISAYEKDSPIQGYPVKEVFFKSARVRERLETIIFLGGSQGATAINDLALHVSQILKERGIKIIHQCGERDYERVKAEYEKMGIDVELYSFTKEIASLISRADFAVSRSGASTLWELCANGLPAFFIPYPHAAGDHQFSNADFIVKEEMGWCMREGEGLEDKFLAVLDEHLHVKSKKLIEHSHKDVADEMIKLFENRI